MTLHLELETARALALHSLAKNDCLMDGNKRVAWLATVEPWAFRRATMAVRLAR